MNILGIIPARYGSTRFPGKPLVDIGGRTMIERVYRRASKCGLLDAVVVATDDERIYDEVLGFDGMVVMTSSSHISGTSRAMEALQKIGDSFDVVINIQGDEPFIHPSQISEVAVLFEDEEVEIGTLAKQIYTDEELFNNNVVKVVFDNQLRALYFSRQPIPFVRGEEQRNWIKTTNYYKHIGIYGYRTNILPKITQTPPSPFHLAESLEQLSWLQNGHKIQIGITNSESIAIDTPEDLKKLEY